MAFSYAFKIPSASTDDGLGTGHVDHSFIPGIMVASEFLRFEIRTGRDVSDLLFALFVCVLPMVVALHRLYVLWHRH